MKILMIDSIWLIIVSDLHWRYLFSRFVEWVKDMRHCGFPMNFIKIKAAIKTYLDRAKVKTQFQNNRPGKTWWYGFLRRHPNLKIGKAENLETTRASISAWFQDYKELLQRLKITSPAQIFNCSESGFPLQVKKSLKVCVDQHVGRNFKKVLSDKDAITTLQCVCANGSVLPPSVFFPGKNWNSEYTYQLPRNGFFGFSATGWMNTEDFNCWVENFFIKNIPPIRPVVLLIDGQSSHTDLITSKLCIDNDIILFRLPPHISSTIQPFSNFKNNFEEEAAQFLIQNPNVSVTKRTFGVIFSNAYQRTCNATVIQCSFKATGIWPVDMSAVAIVLDRHDEQQPHNQPSPIKDQVADHPTHKALVSLEAAIGSKKLKLFQMRLQDQRNNPDPVFQSWKVLWEGWNDIKAEMENRKNK